MRVAVVTPIPTPYRDPFWNVVARRDGIELHVFYCSAGKSDRPWSADWDTEFAAEVLPGRNLLAWRGADQSCYWNPSVARRLRDGGFDAVVVGGYNHPTMLSAIRTARRLGIPDFLMCETYGRPVQSRLKRWMKDRLVRAVVSHAAGCFPTGERAERYLLDYGANPERLTRIPNVPHIERFEGLRHARPEAVAELRRRHGLSSPFTLFTGRLIAKKRADLLLRAHTAAETDHELVFVGDGPERPRLEALADELGVADRVRFIGFVQPDEVAAWLAAADCFVLPSTETWGVVVVEAVASGTPVIVSDGVGCHPDVVRDPIVGDVVPAGDFDALREAIERRTARPNDLDARSATWQTYRDEFRYETLAERFEAAIRSAVSTSETVGGRFVEVAT